MSTIATTWRFLEPRLGSSYKQLFIKGTKFRADVIASAAFPRGDDDDQTPEEVAENYGIPVEAVYEAIRYIDSKPVEVAYDQRVSDLLAEATGAFDPDYTTNVEKHRRILGPEVHMRIEEQAARETGFRNSR